MIHSHVLSTGYFGQARPEAFGYPHHRFLIFRRSSQGKPLPVRDLIKFMATSRLPYSATFWRSVGIVVGLGGILLLVIGLGTALDYMVAQSHPIEPTIPFLLRAEYTLAGVFFIISGFGLARKVSGSTVATDHEPQ